ncbi:MAG: PilZ domain-containing protein [Candidatus Omnitrophica bacterium]|nr:PilZ domain-containing protein [Candidatus Omnitrophota bacterium]
MDLERRDSKRSGFSFPIRYQLKGSQRFGNTVGKDISDSGMRFISNEFFPLATHLIFEVQHPMNRQLMRTLGEVMWVSTWPYHEKFSVGVKFLSSPMSV